MDLKFKYLIATQYHNHHKYHNTAWYHNYGLCQNIGWEHKNASRGTSEGGNIGFQQELQTHLADGLDIKDNQQELWLLFLTFTT